MTVLRSRFALPVLEFRGDVVAVHAGDEIDGDFFGADRFTLAVHSAASEVLFHDLYHAHDALVALGLALGQEAEVRDLGGSEQLRGSVRALRHARAALDAG